MGTCTIRSVLIANRGEIALRILRTCREMGIRVIAVYSEVDRTMPHAVQADEAYPIGPAPASESYLRGERIIDAARAAHADAIHPGYGFLAENPAFARAVRDAGLVFIGPPAEAIEAMGDKPSARSIVRSSGVPVVPGSARPMDDLSEAQEFCRELGYPVLLKAAAGGGGKGMRSVDSAEELPSSFRAAQSEAQSAFGDPRVYVEKLLEQPRHIEFQVLADAHGRAIHLGERECSLQRRHQKIIEESPSVLLDDELRRKMGDTAVRAALACGYVNAGTIEFLVDRQKNFYFLEMNTRLQVEHPVTEERTGIDLVAEQIRIAEGRPLEYTQDTVEFRGHAIECRICAEDPANAFLPSTGRLQYVRPPQGPGIREDRGYDQGSEVSVYYDSLLAKVVAWAPSRTAAIERMRRALREYRIIGVTTNISMLLSLLEHPAFARGELSTDFVRRHFHDRDSRALPETSLYAAAALCVSLHTQEGGRHPAPERADRLRVRPGWKSLRSTSWRQPRG
jgi:acetyl-CoA carboxylase biotin carboxylase subunit